MVRLPPDLNVLAAGQYIQGRILCPVVVGYIPEKSDRQKKHRQQDTRGQPAAPSGEKQL